MSNTTKKIASAIKDASEAKTKGYDTSATVKRVEGNTIWVHIPGGVEETPVRRTIDAKEGDSVQVRVAGGKAWLTGNESRPPTDDSTANYAVNIANEANKTVVQVQTIVTDEIDAQRAVIGELEADTAKIHNLTADQLSATVGYIGDLTADNVTASDIVADHAMIEDLDVQSMSAATAYIRDLTSENITAQDIIADHATIDTLDSTYATIDELHSDYAEIDLANVNNAWIQSGVIKNGAIADAQIIGVSANKLTAGTIDASNITVTNLNASNITTGSITVDGITIDVTNNEASIDGSYIDEGTITLNGLAQEVTDKIDGAIETFTGNAVPTLNNYPASSWTTSAIRDTHIGDVYYVINAGNQADGYCYRFAKSGNTYQWVLIKDSDVTAALGRLTTAEGKITGLESFESTTSSWITETDEELSSLKTNVTSLTTRVGDAEDEIETKVDTSTFNELSQTVGENSSSITSLTTITTNNGLTSSTNITNTVNNVSQTATSNSTHLSQLTTTLGTNADGTTKAGDIVHKVSDIDQDLDGITTRVGKTEVQIKGTYATSSTGASTKNKVATITPTVTGWELYTGATVTVKFTAKNTTTTPALNVNGTGAKSIKSFNGSALTEAEYKWAINDTITFVYNGTYWLMQSSSTQATRLSNAETEISQNATQIQSKASQTDLNTLTGRVSTAESTITQQATAIEARVSKDGVIASINASVEEEGGSAVRISADKVNIEGAAIFTGSGRLSSTSLNNAYDSKGSASTAESNAKGYADGLADDLQDEIDAKKSVHTLMASNTNGASYATILGWAQEETSVVWLVTSTAGVKVGDTVRIAYKANDMGDSGTIVYVVATVTEVTNSTKLIATSHGLDTTVIDGGHILTGTIDASKVNVSNLTVGAFGESGLRSGGKNLLNGTLLMLNGSGSYKSYTFRASGGTLTSVAHNSYDMPVPGLYRSLRCTNNGTATGQNGFAQDNVPINIKSGTYVTMSAWVKASADNLDFRFQPFWFNNSSPFTAVTQARFSTSTNWTYYSTTFKVTTNITPNCSAGYCYVSNLPVNGWFDVTGLKLEVGTIATEFTDDTEFDGDNLFGPGSDCRTSLEGLSNVSASGAAFTIGTVGGKQCAYVDGAKGVTKYLFSSPSNKITPQPNEFFTFSCDLNLSNFSAGTTNPFVTPYFGGTDQNSSGSWRSGIPLYTTVNGIQHYLATNGSDFPQNDLNGKGWVHVSYAFQFADVTFNTAFELAAIYARDFTGRLAVKNIKLERGYKDTGWTEGDGSKTASSYITKINDNGIRIHPASTENNSVVINADGMEVFKGGIGSANSVAFYGETARVGKSSSQRVELTSSAVDIYDSGNKLATRMDTNGLTIYKQGSKRAATTANGLDIFGSSSSSFPIASFNGTGLELGLSSYNQRARVRCTNTYAGFEIIEASTSTIIEICSLSYTKDGDINLSCSNGHILEITAGAIGLTSSTSRLSLSNIANRGIFYNGPNNVLWAGSANYMGSGSSVTLSDNVSNQLTGIVLVWSRYANGAAQNDSWSYQFVPKWHVLDSHTAQGIQHSMPLSGGNSVCIKYVYVYDDKITGHADNTKTGTGYTNNARALRAVLGV